MNPRVKSVIANEDFILEIIFNNDERKQFDVKPYLDFGIFSELKDIQLFKTAKVDFGTVVWKNGLDVCPDTLYLESVNV